MDYGRHIIAKIVPSSDLSIEVSLAVSTLEKLLGQVTKDYFPEPYSTFLEIYSGYFLQKGGVLPDVDTFEDLVSKAELSSDVTPTHLMAVFYDAKALSVLPHKFSHALEGLIESYDREQWGKSLVDAMDILTQGKRLGSEDLKGYQDSRDFILRRTSAVKSYGIENPELDIRDPSSLVKSYTTNDEVRDTVKTGYPYFDDTTGGGQRGDMWVIGAHTGDGKSFLMQNISLNAMVSGKNVVYGSAEMHPSLVMRRFYGIHSRNRRFQLSSGIRLNDIKFQRIPRSQEEVFFNVVLPDLQSNPNYGALHTFSIPSGANIEWIASRLLRYRTLFRVDLFVLDYASIVRSSRRRGTEREELDDVLKELKQLALGFNNGEGLVVLTAMQTNRQSWDRALQDGYYNLSSFAGSAEAENSADVALYLLRTEECREQRELIVGLLKVRDGDVPAQVRFFEDYGTGYLGELR